MDNQEYIHRLVNHNVHEASVSAIKEMAMLAAKIQGVASLTWGLPSFPTPDYIREGVRDRLQSDPLIGKYTLPDGLPELRACVAEYHANKTGVVVDADQHIMISAGNMQALNTLFHTMLDPGDEIILTDPCFASHIQQILLFDGTPVYWPMNEADNWSLDIDLLPALITEKTQAIVLVSPSNPTGKIFTESELRKVADIAVEHDVMLFIDDPYSDFVYEYRDSYFNLATVEKYRNHIVYMYSFSKAYAMSGWRLSYMVMPEELKNEAIKVHDATMICAPSVSQVAGIIALTEEGDHNRQFEKVLLQRRELIEQRVADIPHVFRAHSPEGAYYLFPEIITPHDNARDFSIDLLHSAKVAVTPGSAFGPSGEGHVRMAYCVDEETINLAFDRIEKYFS